MPDFVERLPAGLHQLAQFFLGPLGSFEQRAQLGDAHFARCVFEGIKSVALELVHWSDLQDLETAKLSNGSPYYVVAPKQVD